MYLRKMYERTDYLFYIIITCLQAFIISKERSYCFFPATSCIRTTYMYVCRKSTRKKSVKGISIIKPEISRSRKRNQHNQKTQLKKRMDEAMKELA